MGMMVDGIDGRHCQSFSRPYPSLPKAILMTSISGKTTNGFTYEGDYEHASPDRVTWTAIFRRSGVFFGMRHGRVNELTGVPAGEISEAVQDDIEFVWVQAR
jgi:hypothetical protein